MKLQSIVLREFRSLGGAHEIPLDASIVLIHGGNGAGKTSLLSAIELALTGEVGYMARVDGNYKAYLAHNKSPVASITLTCKTDRDEMSVTVDESDGWAGRPMLSDSASAEFVERNFLAQAQLSRLLEMYQTVDSSKESALSRFVRELLRLDEVDALIEGLEFTRDVRNTRRLVPGWLENERDIAALGPQLEEMKLRASQSSADVAARRASLVSLIRSTAQDPAELSDLISGIGTDQFRLGNGDEQELRRAAVAKNRLAILRRGFANLVSPSTAQLSEAPSLERTASADLSAWWSSSGRRIEALLDELRLTYTEVPEPRIAGPLLALETARRLVESDSKRAKSLVDEGEENAAKQNLLTAQLRLAEEDLTNLQGERASLAPSSDSLLASLSEIVGLIDGDHCPVCGRDFSEVSEESLERHLASRLADDLHAAGRLIEIGNQIADREREIASVKLSLADATPIDIAKFRDLSDRTAECLLKADSLRQVAERGERLIVRDTTAAEDLRQLMVDHERWASLEAELASMESDVGIVAANVDVVIRVDAVEEIWMNREVAFSRNAELIERAHDENNKLISASDDAAHLASQAQSIEDGIARRKLELRRADDLRDGAKKSRDNLIKFRTDIVRKVFSESFNALWRDMFSRLAPGEPFTPAFEVIARTGLPTEVRLETRDELGNAAASPGAMLSAGNINTAALTLFLALHFSAKIEQPVLVLDDPVQSMDDVHISQLAALLRSISSSKSRQVVLAVHDRNLFEYLRLELSPASPADSLITVELDRSANAATRVRSSRIEWEDDDIAVSA